MLRRKGKKKKIANQPSLLIHLFVYTCIQLLIWENSRGGKDATCVTFLPLEHVPMDIERLISDVYSFTVFVHLCAELDDLSRNKDGRRSRLQIITVLGFLVLRIATSALF